MKIATRDLLAALLVEALDHAVAVAALRCLAAYCHTIKREPPALPLDLVEDLVVLGHLELPLRQDEE